MVCSISCELLLRFFDVSFVDEVECKYFDFFEIVIVIAKCLEFFLPTIEPVK